MALKNFRNRFCLVKNLKAFILDLSIRIPENTIVIVTPRRSGLGDIYYICGLSEKLMRKNNCDKCIIYMRPKYFFIAKMFPLVKPKNISPIIHPDRIENYYWTPKKILYAHITKGLSGAIGRNGFTLIDGYRTLFNLEQNAKISGKIKVTDNVLSLAKKYMKDNNLSEGTTTIICPDSNSSSGLSKKECQLIYKDEVRKGNTPIINTTEKEKWADLQYTKIPLEIIEAVFIIAGKAICVRSGICDLISDLDIEKIILYPEEEWLGGTLFNSTSLGLSGLSNNQKEVFIKDYIKKLENE